MKSKITLMLMFIFLASLAFSYNGYNVAKSGIPQEKPTKKTKKTVTKKDNSEKVDEMPQLIEQANPKYPESAQKEGIQGVVYVKILVDELGSVKEVEVAKMTDGNKDISDAALEAAKKCKFKAGKVNGKPVECWVTLPYRFKLK